MKWSEYYSPLAFLAWLLRYFFCLALEFWNQTCVTRLLSPVICAIRSKSWPSGFESRLKLACSTCSCSSVNVVRTRFDLAFVWWSWSVFSVGRQGPRLCESGIFSYSLKGSQRHNLLLATFPPSTLPPLRCKGFSRLSTAPFPWELNKQFYLWRAYSKVTYYRRNYSIRLPLLSMALLI